MPTHPTGSGLIPLSQIHPNPDQPRKYFDPAKMEELKNSLRERGLIQPIAIIKRSEGDFLIAAGERRYRAAKELGWKDIDVRIWPEGTPSEEIEELSLVENLQREDLDPIELAGGYRRLTKPPYTKTQAEIAKAVGKSESEISRTMRFLALPGKIQDDLRMRKISPDMAVELLPLPTDEMKLKTAEIAIANDLNRKGLRALIQKLSKRRATKAPKVGRPAEDPLADLWSQIFGSGTVPHPEAWGALYKKGVWEFKVDSTVFSSQELLGDWFLAMGQAIKGITSPEAENLSKIPADLLKIAEKGPAAVVSHCLGSKHPVVKDLIGKSWADVGAEGPQEGVPMLLAQVEILRAMEKNKEASN